MLNTSRRQCTIMLHARMRGVHKMCACMCVCTSIKFTPETGEKNDSGCIDSSVISTIFSGGSEFPGEYNCLQGRSQMRTFFSGHCLFFLFHTLSLCLIQ